MKKNTLKLLCVLLIVSAFSLQWGVTSVSAGVEPSPFQPISAGGLDSTIFRIMFDPQPEPPGYVMDVTIDDQGILLFSLLYGSNGVGLFLGATGITSITNSPATVGINFQFLDALGVKYQADVTFMSGGYSFTGSEITINPQPEPPVGFPAGSWMTIVLGQTGATPFAEDSPLDMKLRLMDSNNDPIALQPVPEPASMLLMATGVAGLIAARRRKKA